MAIEVIEIQDVPNDLKESEVWTVLGAGDRVVPGLAKDVARGTELSKTLCSPRGLYTRLEVDQVGPKGVSFVDGPYLDGKFLAHCFEGAREAIFAVVTVGPELEKSEAELFAEGSSVEAIVLDVVGSASIMNAFSHISNLIYEDVTDRGWQTGRHTAGAGTQGPQRSRQVLLPLLSGHKMPHAPGARHRGFPVGASTLLRARSRSCRSVLDP
jgi:hypothetical protein